MENIKDISIETGATPGSGEKPVRRIKRAAKKRYTAEDKIRIVLEGLRKEISVAELWRREGIHAQVYYSWSKDFMEAGKSRLQGDTLRNANDSQVKELRKENESLKNVIGEQVLEMSLLKKIMKKQ